MCRHSKRDTHEPRTEASVKTETCQHLNLRFSGSRIVRENFRLLKPVVFHQSGPRRLTGLQANGSASSSQGDGDPPSEATVSSLGAEQLLLGFKRRARGSDCVRQCGDALEPPGLISQDSHNQAPRSS